MTLYKRFADYDPTFSDSQKEFEFIKSYKGEYNVLMLMGKVGTGKTHLARAWIEQARINRLNFLCREHSFDMQSHNEKMPGTIRARLPFIKSTEMYHGILKYLYPGIEANKKACDFEEIINYSICCVIDDLGNEKFENDKDNFKEGFIDLLESDIKLIITTNLNENQILERYGEKIFSRMKESYKKLTFKGKDYRRED